MLSKCLFLSTLSLKKVTLTIMSMSMLLTLSRMPWKYRESCILTQCSAKIVIRYLLDQGMYHTSTMREGWSQRPLRNMVTISDKSEKSKKKWEKWGIGEEKVRKVRKKVLGCVSSSLLHTQVRLAMSNYIQLPANAPILIIYQQGGTRGVHFNAWTVETPWSWLVMLSVTWPGGLDMRDAMN